MFELRRHKATADFRQGSLAKKYVTYLFNIFKLPTLFTYRTSSKTKPWVLFFFMAFDSKVTLQRHYLSTLSHELALLIVHKAVLI